MKKIFFFFLLFSFNNCVQAQNSPNFPEPYSWGVRNTIYNAYPGFIAISFEQNSKQSICNGMGYSFYRIENEYNEKIQGDIYFDYIDCNGNIQTEHCFFYYDNGPNLDQDLGHFITGGYAGTSITNIRIINVRFPDREAAAAAKAAALKRQQDSIANAQQQYQEQKAAQQQQQQEKINAIQQNYQNKINTINSVGGAVEDATQTIGNYFINRSQTTTYDPAAAAYLARQKVILARQKVINDSISNQREIERRNRRAEKACFGYTSNTIGLDINYGISYLQIPLIANNTTDFTSNTQESKSVDWCFGGNFWLFRGPNFGIGFSIDYLRTIGSLATSMTPYPGIFNSGIKVLVGQKKVKAIFEYSWVNLIIKYESSTKDSTYSSYLVNRTSFGVMYDYSKVTIERNVGCVLFWDTPQFLPITDPSILGIGIFWKGILCIGFEYSLNYAIVGTSEYKLSNPQNENYYSISLKIPINVFGKRYSNKNKLTH